MIKHTILETKKIRYCKMMGPNSLVDLYKFAVNLFDDPKRPLNVLLLTEIFSWASFQYKSELLEIIDSVGNDRIGEKMAVVIPNTTVNNSVDYSLKNLRYNSFRVRYFSNEETALTWLEG